LILFYLEIFLASLLFSIFLTKYVRHVSTAHGWVAAPTLSRHLHNEPLPRLGGIAIFLSFVLSLGLGSLICWRCSNTLLAPFSRTALAIFLPATLVFLLGVYDDLHPVSAYTKFAVQIVAAVMLFAGGLRIFNLPLLFGDHRFSWFVGLLLTIFWVLAITNAFNLIDGVDGLAAGSALLSTLVVFAVAVVSQASLVSIMTLALAGGILGFLRFNFSPATIFLGDCGSLFIGFMLSALALQGAQKSPTIIAVAVPLVSFGLPIVETTLSIVRRLISGRPIFIGDREHIHHKLLQRGLSPRQVVITLYAVSAAFAAFGLFLLWPTSRMFGLVLAVLGTGVWVGVQRLGYPEFGELRRVAQRTIERQILVNNLAMRRATEELKSASDGGQICRILASALGGNDFDAFDLRLHTPCSGTPAIRGLQLISGWEEAPRWRWTRPGTCGTRDFAPAWSLTLDLITSSGRRCGSMTIYRLHNENELQLDINLLTSKFPVALANALDRSLAPAIGMIPVTQDSALLTAHAG